MGFAGLWTPRHGDLRDGHRDMMWFLAFVFNGLAVISYEPFNSEEACVLAAKQANIAQFDCLRNSKPDEDSK
jgi:hypothetical protein